MLRGRTFLLIVLGLAAVLRLTSLLYPYLHPDEVITVGVALRIVDTGSLDTNWKLAALPGFKYPQYNFSSYLLSAAAVIKVVRPLVASLHWSPVDFLRICSALLGILAVALTWMLGRQLFNARTGLIAAFFAALCPLLYQDSLYARPETFVTVLTLAYILLLGTERLRAAPRVFLASILLGLLIATKVSMLMLVPLVAIATFPGKATSSATASQEVRATFYQAIGGAARLSPLICGGALLGFAAGAPFALVNFDDYLSGLRYLSRQYVDGSWPHGLPDGSFSDRLGYAVRYFTATMGYLLLLLSLVGAGLAMRRRNWRPLLVLSVALLTALRFSTYGAFFERNISHVVPIFLISSAYALERFIDVLPHRLPVPFAAAALAVALAAYPSARITYAIRFVELPGVQERRVSDMRSRVEAMSGARATKMDWTKRSRIASTQVESGCGPSLFEFVSFDDRQSSALIGELERNAGYREVGTVPSPFSTVPPSTLNTYFTPTTVFLLRNGKTAPGCSGPEGHAAPG